MMMKMNLITTRIFSLFLLFSLVLVVCVGEVWEKDMSEDIYIEASHEGFTSVELSCGRKSMVVEVTMEEDFDGVIYTRGSFMTKYERGKGKYFLIFCVAGPSLVSLMLMGGGSTS